jgi:hypothetical protein
VRRSGMKELCRLQNLWFCNGLNAKGPIQITWGESKHQQASVPKANTCGEKCKTLFVLHFDPQVQR